MTTKQDVLPLLKIGGSNSSAIWQINDDKKHFPTVSLQHCEIRKFPLASIKCLNDRLNFLFKYEEEAEKGSREEGKELLSQVTKR